MACAVGHLLPVIHSQKQSGF